MLSTWMSKKTFFRIWARSSARATAWRLALSENTPEALLTSKPPKLRPAASL